MIKFKVAGTFSVLEMLKVLPCFLRWWVVQGIDFLRCSTKCMKFNYMKVTTGGKFHMVERVKVLKKFRL